MSNFGILWSQTNIKLFLSCYPVDSDPGFYPAQKLSPRSLHVKGGELRAAEQQHHVPCRGSLAHRHWDSLFRVQRGSRSKARLLELFGSRGFFGNIPCSQCGRTSFHLEHSTGGSSSSSFPRMRWWCRIGLSARERSILLSKCPPSFCPTFHSLFLYKLRGRN